jgi:hypothetical protein
MDQYNVIIAKAHIIADNERQRQEREQELLDTNSELSVLASSLFNGMDGIEIGGGIIDHETQDDASGEINSGANIQGVSSSPRRTRSGKIVKYKDE